MISSIQANAGWLPANQAPQVAAREATADVENDGDGDDAVRSVKAAPSRSLPEHMGSRIDTLA